MIKLTKELEKRFNHLLRNTNRLSLLSRYVSQRADKTHFGFESVTADQKASRVKQVFTSVANSYDLMNDAMSFGVHRYWKQQFVRHLDPLPTTRLIDVCGGTGDIAFQVVRHMRKKYPNDNQFKVVVCDINEDMLKVGQNRAKQELASDCHRIEWVLGDAMSLPFEDNSFDSYTVAFGIRNVVDIPRALSEAHRVLRSGGQLSCLEFSRVRNPVMSRLYDWYSFQIIPVLGEVLAKDWKSYQYLVESIRRFPDQNDFKALIESSGFTLVSVDNFLDGIAAIHTGFKK